MFDITRTHAFGFISELAKLCRQLCQVNLTSLLKPDLRELVAYCDGPRSLDPLSSLIHVTHNHLLRLKYCSRDRVDRYPLREILQDV